MRKPTALVLTTVLLAVAVACGGGGEDTLAGQSGEPPVVEEETTTTTETPVTEDTLPEREVEIPDTADTGLVWDEEPVVDESTGRVNVYDFNRMVVEATDLTVLVPKDEFDALSGDELEAALADATVEAPGKAVALYLGLEPGQADTQMLVGNVGGPEGWRVIVIQLQEDDSIRAVRWEFTVQVQPRGEIDRENQEIEGTSDTTAPAEDTGTTVAPETTTTLAPATPDLVPVIYTGERTIQCQPGRGHQDFTVAPCV